MSMVPYWMRHLRNLRPSRFEDELVSAFARDPFFRDPVKYMQRMLPEAVRDHVDGVMSADEVKVDGKKLEVHLDVRNFKPNEINVKTVGNEITVEGKSEIKKDGGWTKSHFERRFLLPEGFPPERVECHFDKGKLLLVAFRAQPVEERKIPITDKSESTAESKEKTEKKSDHYAE